MRYLQTNRHRILQQSPKDCLNDDDTFSQNYITRRYHTHHPLEVSDIFSSAVRCRVELCLICLNMFVLK